MTGPYRMVVSEPQQRIYQLRRDWWASNLGFQRLPRVERIIYLPSYGDEKRLQGLMLNELDIFVGSASRHHRGPGAAESEHIDLDRQGPAVRFAECVDHLPGIQQPRGALQRPGDPSRHRLCHRPRAARGDRLARQ